MKELIKKDWDYILYEDNQKFILSVLAGTIALYNIDIILNEDESLKYQATGQSYIDQLASEIRSQPEKYLNLGKANDTKNDEK